MGGRIPRVDRDAPGRRDRHRHRPGAVSKGRRGRAAGGGLSHGHVHNRRIGARRRTQKGGGKMQSPAPRVSCSRRAKAADPPRHLPRPTKQFCGFLDVASRKMAANALRRDRPSPVPEKGQDAQAHRPRPQKAVEKRHVAPPAAPEAKVLSHHHMAGSPCADEHMLDECLRRQVREGGCEPRGEDHRHTGACDEAAFVAQAAQTRHPGPAAERGARVWFGCHHGRPCAMAFGYRPCFG